MRVTGRLNGVQSGGNSLSLWLRRYSYMLAQSCTYYPQPASILLNLRLPASPYPFQSPPGFFESLLIFLPLPLLFMHVSISIILLYVFPFFFAIAQAQVKVEAVGGSVWRVR